MLSLMTAAAQRSYMMYLKKLFEQGKFGAFFASIPLPIFAAAHCILFGLVAYVGLSFLQFTNMNSLRNIQTL
ncbi:hypothetical protein S83_066017 [Arachis hypogaea]